MPVLDQFGLDFNRRMKEVGKKSKDKKSVPIEFDVASYRNSIAKRFVNWIGADKAVKLEKSIYNYTIDVATARNVPRSWNEIKFKKIYNAKVRDLLFNLSECPALANISIRKLPYMTSHELRPEIRQPLIDKKLQKELRNMLAEKEMNDGTGMFKCPKCKSHSTTYYSMQTRSADEPMTNYST